MQYMVQEDHLMETFYPVSLLQIKLSKFSGIIIYIKPSYLKIISFCRIIIYFMNKNHQHSLSKCSSFNFISDVDIGFILLLHNCKQKFDIFLRKIVPIDSNSQSLLYTILDYINRSRFCYLKLNQARIKFDYIKHIQGKTLTVDQKIN